MIPRREPGPRDGGDNENEDEDGNGHENIDGGRNGSGNVDETGEEG